MFNPSPSLIVICGPPLPGRTELARALAARRGATLFTVRDGPPPADEVRAAFARELDVIVDGELPRRSQRLEVLALAPDGKSALLVEWIGSHEQAEREAIQRYAGRPRPIEEAALKAYEADVAAREPIAGEVPEDRLVIVSSAASLLDQTLAVEGALPPRTLPEAQAAPPPR